MTGEKRYFFSLQQDMLALEFVGTIDGLRADFEEKKANVIDSCNTAIEKLMQQKSELVLPPEYETASDSRKRAIEMSIEAKRAEKDDAIDKIRQQLEKTKELTIDEMKYFELTPIKL